MRDKSITKDMEYLTEGGCETNLIDFEVKKIGCFVVTISVHEIIA